MGGHWSVHLLFLNLDAGLQHQREDRHTDEHLVDRQQRHDRVLLARQDLARHFGNGMGGKEKIGACDFNYTSSHKRKA